MRLLSKKGILIVYEILLCSLADENWISSSLPYDEVLVLWGVCHLNTQNMSSKLNNIYYWKCRKSLKNKLVGNTGLEPVASCM